MAVYREGSSTNTSGLRTVGTTNLKPNKEYIFEYGAPAIAFSLLSPEAIASLIKGWLRLKGEIVSISGITINTDNGHIQIRAKVVPQSQIMEAGVNPLAVFAVIAGLFAAIGVGVSLLYVYELTSGGASGSWTNPTTPGLDPCQTSGVVNYVRCLANKSKLVLFGLSLGALFMLVFILLLVGRKQ